ncbi:non-classical export protein [Ophiostoma piceae UAMH 11346]|uniref:Non-classical export protein n=1 Tax=Ophiostoma piceae (strain UAMH 11346) TaxID=1262450 RepID=S3BNK3_OPHP1|nr:non-classical export protein [Ophiostoma piceae UAMH 11346]
MEPGSIIVRGVQMLWIVLLVALLGNVISDNNNGHMSAINYALFATIIAWVACLLGIASGFIGFLSGGIFTYALIALDALAILFTFVAAIVLPAKLKAVDCGGDLSVAKRGSGWIGFGSEDVEKRCRELQASTVFMWFLFFTLAGSLALGVITGRRSFGGSSGGSSAPHMSQVRV